MTGHVFITRGDIKRICCDAYLVPCDYWAAPDRWLTAPEIKEASQRRPSNWGPDGIRTFCVDEGSRDRPQRWLTDTGSRNDPTWVADGVAQFLREAAAGVRVRKHGAGFPWPRPLLAVPPAGTGQADASDRAGKVIDAIVTRLRALVCELDVDVVFVHKDAETFAAAQAARRRIQDAWQELDEALFIRGKKLADHAASGNLVLFIGAGVSMGAGLPGWGELLEQLAQKAGMDKTQRDNLRQLGNLDRARILHRRFKAEKKRLGEEIASLMKDRQPSLAHQLLASLPVRETVTTNYDVLFEKASQFAERPLAVLPYRANQKRSRWLLKMHGCVTHPADIVLTRDDYLRYDGQRAALAGIVQALLMTKHMLFVGFGLDDDNFHRIADAVRRARGTTKKSFGTALVLFKNELVQELWNGDLEWSALGDAPAPTDSAEERQKRANEAARQLAILLDFVLANSGTPCEHLMDKRFSGVLTGPEQALRMALDEFVQLLSGKALEAPSAQRVVELLESFGWVRNKARDPTHEALSGTRSR